MAAPTQKQLAFLKTLKYAGVRPDTVGEASDLIDALKHGVTSADAEKQMLFERASPIEKAQLYLADAEERKREWNELAGWRLKVKSGAETSKNSIYNGAFLPFEVGRQHPELLAISGLDFSELQRTPAKGPFIVAPNQLSEVSVGKRAPRTASAVAQTASREGKKTGCLWLLIMFATVLCSVGLVAF